MRFVFVLLVAAVHCKLSIGKSHMQCSRSVELLIQVNGPLCLNICRDAPRNILRDYIIDNCNLNSGGPCVMIINVTDIQRESCSPVITPPCSTTTTVITQYSGITPTNCLQSTHTKEMSTTATMMPATGGDSNSSQVILGAFIAVLAALLVAVTTGWIVTCVVNRRKDEASTTSNKDNAVQNPVYDSEHVQRYQGNPPARIQTDYSSQGPAYEQVRVDTATNYDVIDRSLPTTHPVPISDQDYSSSTLDIDEQEHDYYVLESTNAGGPTAVGDQEHDYHVLDSTNAGGQEPQDYEIPLRKI